MRRRYTQSDWRSLRLAREYALGKGRLVNQIRQLVKAFPAILLLLASCSAWASCSQIPMADLSSAAEFASNDDLPFRFPLDEMDQLTEVSPAIFCTAANMRYGPVDKYHAAEDYHLPAGTAVYAMADGRVSFSGPMGGSYHCIVCGDETRRSAVLDLKRPISYCDSSRHT